MAASPMDNLTTAHDIIADLEGRLDKCTHRGDTIRAACPAHDDAHPSLDIKIGDNGECVLLKCWAGCETEDVVKALGLEMRDLFASDSQRWESESTTTLPSIGKSKPDTQKTRLYTLDPTKLPGAPEKLKKGWGAADWDCPKGVDALKAIRGAARSYEAREIVDEADAAKREDTPLPSGVPERVQTWIASLQTADLEGKIRILHIVKAAPEWQQLAVELRIAVVWAIKDRMVLSMATAILGRFDDRTGVWRDPPGGTVDTGVEHFRSIWTYAAEATPVVLVPGLAWRGRVSKISAAPKLGKTSLITNGIAAWQAGQTFLGEQTGPPGSVLYVSETGPAVLRAWFQQYGCPTDAPIIVGGAAAVETIATSAREHKPDLVVIDSLTDLHAASDGGNLWNAGDVRKLLQPLRELECAVVLVHHVRKSDGKSRDSGDFEAAPDMNIYFDPGFDFGGNYPPRGDRRLRYSGRWEECERTLTFDNTDGYALKEPTGGKGPTGEGDPFTAKGPAPTMLDERVNGYIMQYPKSSGRKISEGIECNQRELRPALARLSVAGRITSEEGPRRSILWSVTTTSPTETTDMDGPPEPPESSVPTVPPEPPESSVPTVPPEPPESSVPTVPPEPPESSVPTVPPEPPESSVPTVPPGPPESSVPSVPPNEFGTLDSLGTLNKNGAERDKQNRVYPVYQTLTEGSPGTLDPLNENGGKRVYRDRSDRPDPALAGTLDSDSLAGAKTATAPTPRGGSGEVDTPIKASIPVPDVHTILADVGATNVAPHDSELTPAESTTSADPLLDVAPEERGNTKQTEETGATNVAPTPDRALPAPEVHSSGVMKWDDATSTWVPDDDCWLVGPTKVSLYDGLTVTDGDKRIHKPSSWTDDQWYAWENRGMVEHEDMGDYQ